jgi:hypothetical protein
MKVEMVDDTMRLHRSEKATRPPIPRWLSWIVLALDDVQGSLELRARPVKAGASLV